MILFTMNITKRIDAIWLVILIFLKTTRKIVALWVVIADFPPNNLKYRHKSMFLLVLPSIFTAAKTVKVVAMKEATCFCPLFFD